jgi:hypothetical protein
MHADGGTRAAAVVLVRFPGAVSRVTRAVVLTLSHVAPEAVLTVSGFLCDAAVHGYFVWFSPGCWLWAPA